MRRHLAVWLCTVTLFAAGCSPSQQQQAQSKVNDAFIAAQIKAKISTIDAATVSLVHVQVDNQVVRLSGDVHSQTERAQVLAAARRVSGVKSVIDRLTVNPKAPTAQQLENDVALQARVKTALTEQTGVNAFRVQVEVHNGDVVLSGSVPSKTVRALVLETVHGVAGVKHVRDRLQVSRS